MGRRPHLTVTLLAQLARVLQGALLAQMIIYQHWNRASTWFWNMLTRSDTAESLEYTVVENMLDGRPMDGVTCPELLEYSLRLLDATLDGGLVERISEWEPLMNPAISYTLDSRPMEGTTNLERSALGVSLDSRPTEGAPCLEPLEQLVFSSSLAVRPVEGITKKVWDRKPVINPVISYTLDSQPMEGITYHERLARGVSLDSRPTEGAPCQEPLEQLVLSPSLAAQPDDEVAVKVLKGKPVIQPVQDSTPDGQHMEGTTYLEHPALGVSLDSRLKEGMSQTKFFEQSVLGEGSIVRPETAVTSERHHKQTCFNLSARPTPAIVIVHKTDVNTDMNTDWSDNSAPRNLSEIFEQAVLGERSSVRPEAADVSERHQERTCLILSAQPTTVLGIIHKTDANTDINTDRPDSSDQTQEGQPREGMTKSRQMDLSGFELAAASTDKERLPTSYTLERSELSIRESQSYFKNTEDSQFSYDTRDLEDAIRREVFRNRLVGQVNITEADISMDQLRSEGLRRWNTDMDIEYQYETF